MAGYSSGGGSSSNQNQGDYSSNQSGTSQMGSLGGSSGASSSLASSMSTANPTALLGQLSGMAGGVLGNDGLTDAQRSALADMTYIAQYQPMGFALNRLNEGGLQRIVDTQAPQVAAPGQIGTSSVMAPTAESMS